MRKEQYLRQLRKELKSRGAGNECERAEQYYSELIDESVESGQTEEQAVNRLPLPYIAADEIIRSLGLVGHLNKNEKQTGGDFFDNRPNRNETAKNTTRKKSITERLILLFVFLVFIFPLAIAFGAILFSLTAAVWAIAFSFIISGIAVPVYGVIMGIIGKSAVVLFSFLAGGFVVLAIGLLVARFVPAVAKMFYKTIKGTGKAVVNILK